MGRTAAEHENYRRAMEDMRANLRGQFAEQNEQSKQREQETVATLESELDELEKLRSELGAKLAEERGNGQAVRHIIPEYWFTYRCHVTFTNLVNIDVR
jgi:phosphoenolpyruvate carboxylase